jgi:branched-subunit amino acid aminotransferase/4-amino-4-deoxychorismate lyase
MKINCAIDGRAVEKRKASVSVFDNSLFYADGLFETLLAVGDRIIYLEEHLDRLEKGAAMINIKLPVSRKRLLGWIVAAVKNNRSKIKKVRLTITAGESGFWAGRSGKPKVIIIVTEYNIPTAPFRLTVSPYRIDRLSPFRNIKTLSFITEMTSRKLAYSKGYDDALLLDHDDYVAETSSANIFWIKDGRLLTTPLDSGCLEGMTRRHILGIAERNNISKREEKIKLENLLRADEIFISSSLKLILPVISIDVGKEYKFEAGPITDQLRQLLFKQIILGENYGI